MNSVVVSSSARTAIGSFGRSLVDVPPSELGATAARAAIERAGIEADHGRGKYRAAEADRRAWDNARRPQRCKLALHPALCKLVACKLSEDWSPEQIAGWQKLGSPEDHTCRVSHETIYQTLFIQTPGR